MSTTSGTRRKAAFTRTTVRIETELLDKVDALVEPGDVESRNELLNEALRAELKRRRREEIDAAFRRMAADPEYRAEVDQIMKEFEAADAEAWRLGEEDFVRQR
jgi:metal-responsive CopG/Arc/MetJ family transcriptional regulator